PACFGAATKRAQPSTGSIDEDPIVLVPTVGRVAAAIMGDHLNLSWGITHRVSHELCAVRGHLIRANCCSVRVRLPCEQRRFSARSGTHIHPTFSIAHGPRTGQCKRGEL